MKSAPVSLLVLLAAATALPACTTMVNRRDVYRPKRGDGYWTKRLDKYEATEEGVFGISGNIHYPPGREEGVFGVSRNTPDVLRPGDTEGVFGVSRNRREY